VTILTKRTKREIYSEILSMASMSPVTAAAISRELGIPYNRIGTYIGPLLEKEMLNVIDNGGKDAYVCTDKGSKFLSDYRRLENILNTYGL
jgi:predicted transcriptional regulator